MNKKFKKSKESGKGKFGENTPEFIAALDQEQQWRKISDPSFLPEDSIPKEWDWRNINNFDFTDNLRDQGHCGSCY